MRCPACKERVIDFFTWGQGLKTFRTVDCPQCGASLRTSWEIFAAAFWLITLIGFSTIAALAILRAVEVPKSTAVVICGCIMIPLAIGSAYLVWLNGFYSLRDTNK